MEKQYQLLMNILKGSKRFQFEGTVLTVSDYFSGKKISLDLSYLSEEALEEILVRDDQKYWEEKEELVWNIACKHDLEDALENNQGHMAFNELLFDLFDNGDYEPTEDEIKTAIIEFTS